MVDGLDARNFRGGRIQASGGGTNKASGFSRAAPRLLRRAPERKGGRTRERERENREEGEKRGGGTAGGCAVGFSDEEEIGRGRSREWAAFGKGGAGRGAHGAGLPGRDGRGQGWSAAANLMWRTRRGGRRVRGGFIWDLNLTGKSWFVCCWLA
ncbi:hypothetical protein CFC21_003895 [Triticum aestivum]|uniref:Uncharacterized protein n=2 Tax=Triticum TaxID=4564 RepID=A0A9R0QHY7_TRITD|nr:hypothetical protein CFC21_003895 [Triticum aestivum]VAH10877.1 unnamed protein product [Triticum turgidum subsp. durum]